MARLREEEQSRLRPPGIDDWCNEIARQADAVLAALPCAHADMVRGFSGSASPGYTYVIQAEGQGLVKIGRAQDAADRLCHVQAMSPVRLHIVAIAAGIGLEREWHKRFHRLRRHREWFAPEVAQFFIDHGAPGCVRCAIYGDGKVRSSATRTAP